MPLRLPPLPALRFFEAAGRHQSFKLAAAELNVTPSAVSHGIVGLEEALGVELAAAAPRRLSRGRDADNCLGFRNNLGRGYFFGVSAAAFGTRPIR
nr:LysR family transcriptional regulator [Paraburkholderia antibiotica]